MKKAKACYADGGVVGSDGLTDAQREKKNATLRALGMSTSAPAPVQAPVPVPEPQAPQPMATGQGIMGILKGRQQQIDKAAGYACGGKVKAHANGGKIKGIGTPTSDSIPAKVRETGEQIRVSTGERIVSSKQEKLLQRLAKAMGYKSLDEYLEAGTGKPVGPTIKGGKKAMADGGSIYDPAIEDLKKLGTSAFPNTTAVYKEVGKDVSAAMDRGNYGNAFGLALRGAPVTAIGAVDDVVGGAYRGLTGMAKPVISGVTGEIGQDTKNTGLNSAIDARPAKFNKPLGPQITDISVPGTQFMTGQNGAMPDSSGGGFVQGNRAYNVNATSQPGIQRVTSQGTSPLYTNIKPEDAVSGLNNQPTGGGWNLAEQNEKMVKSLGYSGVDDFNKQFAQKYSPDAPPPGGWMPNLVLGYDADGTPRQERINAETAARWRTDDLLSKINRGNQAAVTEAIRANSIASLEPAKQRLEARKQDIQSRGDDLRNAALMRDQDINAFGDRAKLAMLERNDQRRADQFGLQKRISEGALADSEAQRTARNNLNAAIASGDPAAISKAHTMAVASGLKFDREDKGMKPIEIADPTDKTGMRKILVQPNADGTYTPMQAKAQQQAAPEGVVVPKGHTFEKMVNGKPVFRTPDGKLVWEQ